MAKFEALRIKEFIRQFEVLRNLETVWEMLLESKSSPGTFSIQILFFCKIQTVIKSHSLMPGASNLAILMFSTCFFRFWPT